MTSLIDIFPASEDDFPILAHIAAVAMGVGLIHRIKYESTNVFDTSPQEQFLMAEFRRAKTNPQAHIYKATAKSSGDVVGYALFRFDDGKETSPSGPSTASYPPGANTKFIKRISEVFREVHLRHMGGKRHVWWSSLMVLPEYQKMGIGSALLRHGFETLGADEMPIWLVTQMRGRAMYLKFGSEDVDVLDVDFSEYAGPYRGFGVHRSICMVRQPGGVPSSGPKPEITW